MWLTALVQAAVVFFLVPVAVLSHGNLRTLRTFRRQVCDDEELALECWPDTLISVTEALYQPVAASDVLCRTPAPDPDPGQVLACRAKDLREVIQQSCREQQECQLHVSPQLLSQDLCSGVQRYLSLAYKCRPNKFKSAIACHREKLKINCPKSLRIIIYNAFFGSSSSIDKKCPDDAHKNYEDCKANFATETAMNSCHGRKKCTLSADSIAFGMTGCSAKARTFLKVDYTCVPKDNLQDLEFHEETETADYPSIFKEPDASEILHTLKPSDSVKFTTPSNYFRGPEFNVTSTKKADIQSDETSDIADVNCTTEESEQKVVGFLSEWISVFKFISENKEKFILYVTISLGTGVLIVLLVLTFRLYAQQQQQLKKAKLNISEPLPLAFDEDFSDVDHFADSHHDPSGVEVVRYTNMSTIRRQDSTSQPRAPLSHSMNNYYYS